MAPTSPQPKIAMEVLSLGGDMAGMCMCMFGSMGKKSGREGEVGEMSRKEVEARS